MRLPEFSVKRPVTVTMLILIVVVLGIISLMRLGIELMPDISYPVVSTILSYEGASPEDIENLITKPVEGAIASVKGIKKITSTSIEGTAAIMAEFNWGTNLDFAAQDIRERIEMIRDFLPQDMKRPLIMKFDISMMPVLAYGITSERSPRDLRTFVEDNIKDRLEQIDGVASCTVMGGEEREIQVRVSRQKLASFGLSLQQVVGALRFENVNISGGHVKEGYTEYLVRTLGEFRSLDEISSIVVGNRMGTPVYLRDVAEVYDTHKEKRAGSYTNGKSSVLIMVSKSSGENTVAVADRVKRAIAEMAPNLPPDIEFHEALDQSRLTRQVVSSTVKDALFGAILAVIILLVFLRSLRPTLVIALSIPLSIIATFIPIYFVGYTLNIMTLVGLALGAGLLISNAIIAIENIFRYMEDGHDRITSSIEGVSEVSMAITASTLTTMIVFLPLIYIPGITGKISRGLALTVASALFMSLLVTLTLVPMLASRIFRRVRQGTKEHVLYATERHFQKAVVIYEKVLKWCLRNKKKVLAIVFGLFVLSAAAIFIMDREFIPESDVDVVILKVSLPVGTPLEETRHYVKQIEAIAQSLSDVETVVSFIGVEETTKMDIAFGMGVKGPNEGEIMIRLKEKREMTSAEVTDYLRQHIPPYFDGKVEFIDLAQMMISGGATRAPIEVKIFGKDLNVLKDIASTISDEITRVPGIYDVKVSLEEGKPEYTIYLDRRKAAKLGVSAGLIGQEIRAAFEGQLATRYREAGDEFDLVVKLNDDQNDKPSDIGLLPIATLSGRTVRVGDIANVERGTGPVELTREGQKRLITVSANVSGRSLGKVVKDVNRRLRGVALPEGYFFKVGGEAEKMNETFYWLSWGFAFAVLLVYMVMASEFESFVHPFTIMFTVPLAWIGVCAGLLISGTSLSLTSMMGILVLAGVIVNNGIVLVDYINLLRRKGMDKIQAIVLAGKTKLRAVILTALTAILAMGPMALSHERGAEMRAPMAVSVIGGLLVGTLLTLLVIPLLYTIFDDWTGKLKSKSEKLLAE